VITLEPIHVLAGVFFFLLASATATDEAHPKRFANGAFYFLLALSFLFGSHLSDASNGLLALGMIAVGGVWKTGRGPAKSTTAAEREARASRYRSLLFIPALMVPLFAVLGSTVLKTLEIGRRLLMDPQSAALIWLYLGIVAGFVVALIFFRPPLSSPIHEGRRLMDTVGWALLLPQMLAALGAVFTVSGVGTAVGKVFEMYLPITTRQTALIVFALGMAAFTIIMGNAFAAFPVMMAAIGLPLIVQKFGGNVVALSAIGMLSGFCGTLVTPMAANFNLVPAALLELKDRYAVIRAQAPTAVLLLLANIALLSLVVYR
jgi:uncharacterized membrane protein